MAVAEYLIAGSLAVIAGLDRIAFMQLMISRPLVVGPLTGWALGAPLVGLEVGILLELLWLGRMPVGAAIPPDDTQVTIGATVLAISMDHMLGLYGMPIVILSVLTAIPLGKVGQLFDRLARHANGVLAGHAEVCLASGQEGRSERLHLTGLISFALASLATCTIIVAIGSVLLYLFAPQVIHAVREAGLSLQYSFTMIGAAALLGTFNINRSISLFCAAFIGTFMVLWLR
jgi:PTS system mannose-specific IIC component